MGGEIEGLDRIELEEFVKWIEESKEQAEKAKEEISSKITKGRFKGMGDRNELMTKMYEHIRKTYISDIVLGKIEEYKNNGGDHKGGEEK